MTVFWDWNGTMVADVPHVVETNNRVLGAHGYPTTTEESYRRLFRFPVKEYYMDVGVTEEDFPQIAKEWNAGYVAGFDRVPLAPGVGEAVRRFREAGFRQVILSASQVDQLRAQVVRFPELDGAFDAVLGIADVFAVSKVRIALDYMAQTGLDPRDAVFLGDTNHDAEVARAIGCRCLLISGGHQADDILAATGETVVPNVLAAVELLGA